MNLVKNNFPSPGAQRLSLIPVFSLDLRALGLFRIGLGLTLTYRLLSLFTDLGAFFTDNGVLPRGALSKLSVFDFWWSLNRLNGEYWFQALLWALLFIATMSFTVGYRTRVSTLVCWVLLGSFQYRNTLIWSGGDALLELVLFWGMFLPLGARYSLDGKGKSSPEVNQLLSISSVCFVLQIFFVYYFTAQFKNVPLWVGSSEGMYYALSLDGLRSQLGDLLFEYRALHVPLTKAVMALELFIPWLIFCPLFFVPIRLFVIAAFIGFHLGIALFMNIGLFPFICCVCWIALLPGWCFDRVTLPVLKDRISYPVGLIQSLFCGVCLLFVVWSNLASLRPEKFRVYATVNWFGYAFHLWQDWRMFAPDLIKYDGWIVTEGTLSDGRHYDIYNNREEIDFSKPKSVPATYPNMQWKKYLMMELPLGSREHYRDYYPQYLCREWNSGRGSDDPRRLKSVRVFFMKELTQPGYAPPVVERVGLGEAGCE